MQNWYGSQIINYSSITDQTAILADQSRPQTTAPSAEDLPLNTYSFLTAKALPLAWAQKVQYLANSMREWGEGGRLNGAGEEDGGVVYDWGELLLAQKSEFS